MPKLDFRGSNWPSCGHVAVLLFPLPFPAALGASDVDDARRGLNVVDGVYKPLGSGLTTEEFAKRAAQNKLSKQRAEEEYERKESERQERIRWEELEEERTERERLRIEASRRRALAWFG